MSVLRDEHGIPQIYADNADDLFKAEGFVHAQDRFFEMDLRRHITAGRLSELVGEGGLETDRVIRTLGWRRVAEAELPTLKPETRRYLQAYADGVNAYIRAQGSPSKMSLEYVVLGQKVKDYRVEDWTPADSLAWLKAMAWDLRGDYSAELMRARLAGSMSIAHINELYPRLRLRPEQADPLPAGLVTEHLVRAHGRRTIGPSTPPRAPRSPAPPSRPPPSRPRPSPPSRPGSASRPARARSARMPWCSVRSTPSP